MPGRGARSGDAHSERVGTQPLRLRLGLQQGRGCGRGSWPRGVDAPCLCSRAAAGTSLQTVLGRRAAGRRLPASGRAPAPWLVLHTQPRQSRTWPGSLAAPRSAWLREQGGAGPGCGAAGPREQSPSPASARALRGGRAERRRRCPPGPAAVALAGLSHAVPCPAQSAVGHEYQATLSKHCSQVDSVRGFGGKFGVQLDRVDQVSEAGWGARPEEGQGLLSADQSQLPWCVPLGLWREHGAPDGGTAGPQPTARSPTMTVTAVSAAAVEPGIGS